MIGWLLRTVARWPIRAPKLLIALALVMTVAALLSLPDLHVSTDRNLLSGKDNPIFKRREAVNAMFGTALVGVVILESQQDPEQVKRAADELARALSTHPQTIRDVFYKVDLSFFEQHALLFMPEHQLAKLVAALNEQRLPWGPIADSDGLPMLIDRLAETFENSPAPQSNEAEDVRALLDILGLGIDEVSRWFQSPSVDSLQLSDLLWRGGPAMTGTPSEGGYLVERDKKAPHLAVLFVQPADDSQAMEVVAPLTDLIRAEIARLEQRFPGVTGQLTGMPALATDELRLVSRDCVVAGVASGLGVLLVFVLAFRSIRVSLFLALPLGIGLLWAAGLTAALYGHLTLITSYFAAVLFGLGVAFTIHIVARFHEALADGATKAEAVEEAITRAGPGVVAGGGTTALAFLAIAFSEFKGFAEMGVISGVGVTLILIANLTILPAALLLWHPGAAVVRQRRPSALNPGAGARRRLLIPLLGGVAVVLGVVAVPRLNFDYAVESMLPKSSEAVTGIQTLNERTDFSTTYSVAVAESLAHAEALRQRFAALPTVSRAEALSMFVPGDQPKKVARIEQVTPPVRAEVARAVEAQQKHRAALGATTAQQLASSLEELADVFEDLGFAAARTGRAEAPLLTKLAQKARTAHAAVIENPNDQRALALERHIFEGIGRGLGALNSGLADQGFGPEDLPQAISRRFQSADKQHFAVVVYPAGDIGKKDFFYQHVKELLSVDDHTTGHPVTHMHFTEMVHQGFAQAVVLAAVAVLLLILLDLRTAKGLALALLPVLIGAAWTALVMWVSDLKFNYANLMALPILIGTGVDYGVHLAHRAVQEGSVATALRTTGRTIALSGATTLIGFGSLTLGNHWGVKSLGLVLVIGILGSLIAALVVLPNVVRFRSKHVTTGEGGGLRRDSK